MRATTWFTSLVVLFLSAWDSGECVIDKRFREVSDLFRRVRHSTTNWFEEMFILVLLSLSVVSAAEEKEDYFRFEAPANLTTKISCEEYVRIKLCNAPIVRGPCTQYHVRYGYDPATNTCRRFVYGGCDGNANNYENIEWCELICKYPDSGFYGEKTPAVC
ncbi:unnamed protein product [Calicophoron daubneyi]|uniref:BPTI/Kunitz inhibitor domain-containing protein n=1 Tax=Calicophoron daubneyi TaxID=300641 RepID=A0AAV2TKB5_CALDB